MRGFAMLKRWGQKYQPQIVKTVAVGAGILGSAQAALATDPPTVDIGVTAQEVFDGTFGANKVFILAAAGILFAISLFAYFVGRLRRGGSRAAG